MDLSCLRAFLDLCNENIKHAKGNECNWYKGIAVIVSSSLPICPIHIFSSDTQAYFALITPYNMTCFAIITSHNMPSNMLHTPLYPWCVHNVHNMDSKHAWHDKVKINKTNGQTGGKYCSSTTCVIITTNGCSWPSATVKSLGFFKLGSCFSFF